MKTYEVITPLRRGGKKVTAGKTVDLDIEEAAPLLAKGAIAPARFVKAPPAAKQETGGGKAKSGAGAKPAAGSKPTEGGGTGDKAEAETKTE